MSNIEEYLQFCIYTFTNSVKILMERLDEESGKLTYQFEPFGATLKFASFNGCILLYNLMGFTKDIEQSVGILSEACILTSSSWDNLKLDKIEEKTKENNPLWYEVVKDAVSKEVWADRNKIMVELLSIPDMININEGMRGQYVYDNLVRYYTHFTKHIFNYYNESYTEIETQELISAAARSTETIFYEDICFKSEKKKPDLFMWLSDNLYFPFR